MARNSAQHARRIGIFSSFTFALAGGAALLAPCTSAHAGPPPLFFMNSYTVSLGGSETPFDVGVGDFNSDFHLDLVVASEGEERGFFLLMGQAGDPPFAPPQLIIVDRNAPNEHDGQGILVADVNNDGKQDVIFAREQIGVTMSPGLGNGLFGAPVNILTDVSNGLLHWPLRLTPLELEGDGDLDLVLVDGRNIDISVLRNDGNLAFTLVQTIPVTGATQLTAGDLDGDGDDDIVWAVSGTGLHFAMNDGGSFDAPTAYPLEPGGPWDVEAIDIDLDGDIDLVACIPEVPQAMGAVLANDGTGSSYTVTYFDIPNNSPMDMALADFDGDQRIDVAVLDALGTMFFMRNETTTPGEFEFSNVFHVDSTGPISSRIAVGNFDNDCDYDVLVVNRNNATLTFLTNLSPQFSQCTVADFDFSGSIDADDLAFLLSEWGKVGSPADLNVSGRVDAWDLAFLLWGWQQPAPSQ
jgi:hypothetical protein